MDLAPVPPGSAAAARWRLATLASLAALIVLGLAWELVLAPTGTRTLALKVVPLLLPLRGLWRDRLFTYRALSLLVWVYVAEGAVRATSDRGLGSALGTLEALLAIGVFAACCLHIRARQRTAGPVVA
ncbi:DUF2069 domain-containing protein [Piscinibacter koreensis]|uniref:DUF2069 domain-containing protein n=1 Tax=Piscinibacter koreensis TaxID=2742824 RepID=A0A7Y6TYF5_9BURK|nr:DUF2069 domain-containing protein [Schlegelella koreensis]NUZ08149.1 DUF2069 domain-containing protein [Schlegelella koreensis]